MSRLGRTVAAMIVLALAVPGCFEVQLRDPGRSIDNFEDGDFKPDLPGFGEWSSYSFNDPANPSPKMALDRLPGIPHDSVALSLDFFITDPTNGKQEHGGAGLAIDGTTTKTTLDLSRYQTLGFRATLASGTSALPSDARLYVELGCSTAIAEDNSTTHDFYVSASADFKNYPRTFEIKLWHFGVPPWVLAKVEGGPARCRALVDSIRFAVDEHLADGQAGEGVLKIDDIYLE